MTDSLRRIGTMLLRYLYLHKRSVPRSLEIIFWPVMELLLWGFVTLYIQSIAASGVARTITFLINAMIFWDILYRSQQAVSISFMEEIWTQNIVNLLASSWDQVPIEGTGIFDRAKSASIGLPTPARVACGE